MSGAAAAMLRILKIVFALAMALTGLAWLQMGRLPEPSMIRPELLSDPVQGPTGVAPFTFTYKGKACRVRPVASYELAGLVVSHNDIESVADLYHDSTSVDTKDLCVVWGPNLQSSDLRRVSFRSGSFTCYYRYPPGVRFSKRGLGNNHLITDRAEVRSRIAEVRVGDQVRIKGLLVDYQMDDWQDFWRETSTVRHDDGCEVVFVESLDIVRAGTPGWYLGFQIGRLLVVVLPFVYLAALHFGVRSPTGAA